MITVGVDLAAEPRGTAVAIVDWSAAGAVVRELVVLSRAVWRPT